MVGILLNCQFCNKYSDISKGSVLCVYVSRSWYTRSLFKLLSVIGVDARELPGVGVLEEE